MSTDRHRAEGPRRVDCRVITVSDTRGADDDPSGDAIAGLLVAAGHTLVGRAWCRDDADAIRAELDAATDCAAVVLTGGTGLTARDITWSTVADYCDEPLPAFATLFTQLSYEQVGSAAMLSRAVAGIRRDPGRLIFALPGSARACRLAVEALIAPELGHLAGHLAR